MLVYIPYTEHVAFRWRLKDIARVLNVSWFVRIRSCRKQICLVSNQQASYLDIRHPVRFNRQSVIQWINRHPIIPTARIYHNLLGIGMPGAGFWCATRTKSYDRFRQVIPHGMPRSSKIQWHFQQSDGCSLSMYHFVYEKSTRIGT